MHQTYDVSERGFTKWVLYTMFLKVYLKPVSQTSCNRPQGNRHTMSLKGVSQSGSYDVSERYLNARPAVFLNCVLLRACTEWVRIPSVMMCSPLVVSHHLYTLAYHCKSLPLSLPPVSVTATVTLTLLWS